MLLALADQGSEQQQQLLQQAPHQSAEGAAAGPPGGAAAVAGTPQAVTALAALLAQALGEDAGGKGNTTSAAGA